MLPRANASAPRSCTSNISWPNTRAAATAASWTSLALLPPGELRWQPTALPRYAIRFLWQSVIAGWDVMRRAFSPSLPLRPGLVSYPPRYPRGAGRNAFASLTSLLPGTVPVRDDAQGMVYHCLDIRQPIVEQLAVEETAFCSVLPQAPEP